MCREHGQQLAALAAEVQLYGVIKETTADALGLLEFHRDYFPFPMFRDPDFSLYKALGDRRLSLLDMGWNPLRLWRGYRAVAQRMKEQNITGNLKGEGILQGGILLFDAQGKLQYGWPEETGEPLDMEVVQKAIDSLMLERGSVDKESHDDEKKETSMEHTDEL